MSLLDAAGLLGVGLILIAYAGAALGRMNPQHPPALLCNLAGAGAILASLVLGDFNLSAAVMEGAWALVAGVGLLRWASGRKH